jgi:predicted dithiol-disulfide oxidoreductase (DUF899 family)
VEIKPEQELIMEMVRLEEEISARKKLLKDLRRKLPRQEIDDYTFLGTDNTTVRLSELFGKHNELMVIHNMGKKCSYCTLWADGFNGIIDHLENKAGFVVISPDDPETQSQFAKSRSWRFKIYSSKGSSFTGDMGFQVGDKDYLPGVSTFFKDDAGKIYRVARDNFGPGDNYCGLWHLFDLLPDGIDSWHPRLSY